MSEAEKAYIAAQSLIAIAAREGADTLDLGTPETHALATLPPEITGLSALRSLNLGETGITDLSPLAALTGLTSLYLGNTPITDITALTALTGLTRVDLFNTPITNFAPLAALTSLTRLSLDKTPITDLTPLTALTGLTWLRLADTPITDLTPLTALTNLNLLWLENTAVLDLRPLRHLIRLAEDPKVYGLYFENTPATRADPRIAEIAEIVNDATRARELFAYLETWVPPGFAETDLPPRQPAPLETEIRDNMLVLRQNEQPPLPPGPIDNRARQGWQVLRDFRADFGKSLSIANYRSLAAAIAAFDRAMGDHYDHLHQIGVGLAGQRLSNLSADLAFVETLPDGAGTELATLGAAVTTFANRFPEWLDYLHDPDAVAPMADLVAAALPAFNELAATLAATPGVAPDVAAEFRDEVELAQGAPRSEPYARALLASTTDLLRTLTENALVGMRLYADGLKTGAQDQGRKFVDVVPGELRKAVFWSVVGIATDILVFKSTLILSLAAKFPSLLWWVPKALAALGLT